MNISTLLRITLGIFMLLGGITHFVNPAMYEPLIPEFLPKSFINYLAGIIEIILGIGVLTKPFRAQAALLILILLIIFLPIHIGDVFKENPAIGSKLLAYIRLPLQFLLIYWAWYVRKNANS